MVTVLARKRKRDPDHAITFMAQPNQNFGPVPAVKLLGIMLRNRCWPTTFHTITVGDADGWCQNWMV